MFNSVYVNLTKIVLPRCPHIKAFQNNLRGTKKKQTNGLTLVEAETITVGAENLHLHIILGDMQTLMHLCEVNTTCTLCAALYSHW